MNGKFDVHAVGDDKAALDFIAKMKRTRGKSDAGRFSHAWLVLRGRVHKPLVFN